MWGVLGIDWGELCFYVSFCLCHCVGVYVNLGVSMSLLGVSQEVQG